MTLIELLIAIAIASLLAVAGYRALASLTTSATQLSATTQRWQALDAHAIALERAYRRAIPNAAFELNADTLTFSVLDGNNTAQPIRFGQNDEHVSRWNFAAWDGSGWTNSWRAEGTPAGLRVRLTTAHGEVVERVYAR
jgi:prepilin-type N-terminal cleavage/methylation domain-containing protein